MTDLSGPEWDEFVRNVREGTVKMMNESAMVISLIPEQGFDVKFALELGAAIMLDKPMIAVAHPGSVLPAKLLRVFDEILYVDVDTSAGQEQIQEAMKRIGAPLSD